jgi:hypothetical protein
MSDSEAKRKEIEARVKAAMALRAHQDKCKASAEAQKSDMSKFGTQYVKRC